MSVVEELKTMFKDKDLLKQALTHGSWKNEHPEYQKDNERLEFLGDAILDFIVAEILFEKFPEKQEGELTTLRSKIVENDYLAPVAHHLGIGDAVYLGKGEEVSGGRVKERILSGALEALIGALWLDQKNIELVRKFVFENVVVEIPKIATDSRFAGKHPKSILQEICQQRQLPFPEYQVVNETGFGHIWSFTVTVSVAGETYGKGSASKKKDAETSAAVETLKIMMEKGWLE